MTARELADHNPCFPRDYVARLRKDVKPTIIGGNILIGMCDIFPEPAQMFLCPREETLDFFELIQRAASLSSEVSARAGYA